MHSGKHSVTETNINRNASDRPRRSSTAYDARSEALKIALAPFVFQAARVLKGSGILAALCKAGAEGMSFESLKSVSGFSSYALRVLLDSGETSGILTLEFFDEFDDEPRSFITQVGYFLETDHLTSVQFDFASEVCYQGLANLEESLRQRKPAGLSFLGAWTTVYQALSSLPERVKKAWLSYDHFFSDEAFSQLIRKMREQMPCRILDVGGNTGRLSGELLAHFPHAHVVLADLPAQVDMAREELGSHQDSQRIDFFPIDVLGEEHLPPDQDAIVLSQFLDCFSEDEIIHILKKVHKALAKDGHVYILETLIDRQRFASAKFCIAQASLYFTAIANGNSQMYRYATLHRCITKAGFTVEKIEDHIGRGHSLLVLKTK